jgi:hypothetical protein
MVKAAAGWGLPMQRFDLLKPARSVLVPAQGGDGMELCRFDRHLFKRYLPRMGAGQVMGRSEKLYVGVYKASGLRVA